MKERKNERKKLQFEPTSFSWFRFGYLAEKFHRKTLRDIIAEKKWRTNAQTTTVAEADTPRKRKHDPHGGRRLFQEIERDLKRTREPATATTSTWRGERSTLQIE